MPKVVGYHRPSSVEEAVSLLTQPSAAVLAGGTRLNATNDGDPVVAVDVQALGLSGIESRSDGRIRLGAATTLQQLADHPELPEALRALARRELPSTLRTLATVGGTVAHADWESELLAGLLVCDTVVTVARVGGAADHPLPAVLSDRSILQGGLITAVTISGDGAFAADHTGRTPADTAIVSAVARRGIDGRVRLALSGVAPTPVLVDGSAPLTPPGDFRGTVEYRTHLARVLSDRVRKAVEA
jgi:CO/xanthine dehydrogenase FAD-binding subunit